MFQVYFESIKNLVMRYTSSILWNCFRNAFVFLFWLKSKLEVDFQTLCIYCQTQKYTWSRLSELKILHSNLEVYFKYFFFKLMHLFSNSELILEVDFLNLCIMFKLRIILPVDFLNRCIYFQIQKYTWNRFSKLTILHSNSEVYLKHTF